MNLELLKELGIKADELATGIKRVIETAYGQCGHIEAKAVSLGESIWSYLLNNGQTSPTELQEAFRSVTAKKINKEVSKLVTAGKVTLVYAHNNPVIVGYTAVTVTTPEPRFNQSYSEVIYDYMSKFKGYVSKQSLCLHFTKATELDLLKSIDELTKHGLVEVVHHENGTLAGWQVAAGRGVTVSETKEKLNYPVTKTKRLLRWFASNRNKQWNFKEITIAARLMASYDYTEAGLKEDLKHLVDLGLLDCVYEDSKCQHPSLWYFKADDLANLLPTKEAPRFATKYAHDVLRNMTFMYNNCGHDAIAQYPDLARGLANATYRDTKNSINELTEKGYIKAVFDGDEMIGYKLVVGTDTNTVESRKVELTESQAKVYDYVQKYTRGYVVSAFVTPDGAAKALNIDERYANLLFSELKELGLIKKLDESQRYAHNGEFEVTIKPAATANQQFAMFPAAYMGTNEYLVYKYLDDASRNNELKNNREISESLDLDIDEVCKISDMLYAGGYISRNGTWCKSNGHVSVTVDDKLINDCDKVYDYLNSKLIYVDLNLIASNTNLTMHGAGKAVKALIDSGKVKTNNDDGITTYGVTINQQTTPQLPMPPLQVAILEFMQGANALSNVAVHTGFALDSIVKGFGGNSDDTNKVLEALSLLTGRGLLEHLYNTQKWRLPQNTSIEVKGVKSNILTTMAQVPPAPSSKGNCSKAIDRIQYGVYPTDAHTAMFTVYAAMRTEHSLYGWNIAALTRAVSDLGANYNHTLVAKMVDLLVSAKYVNVKRSGNSIKYYVSTADNILYLFGEYGNLTLSEIVDYMPDSDKTWVKSAVFDLLDSGKINAKFFQ